MMMMMMEMMTVIVAISFVLSFFYSYLKFALDYHLSDDYSLSVRFHLCQHLNPLFSLTCLPDFDFFFRLIFWSIVRTKLCHSKCYCSAKINDIKKKRRYFVTHMFTIDTQKSRNPHTRNKNIHTLNRRWLQQLDFFYEFFLVSFTLIREIYASCMWHNNFANCLVSAH